MVTSASYGPPTEALDALESGVVEITRRVEIYEADASTRWYPEGDFNEEKARLIDGSVSVDYNSDERRKLDLVLDNDDGLLRQNSDGGFWYDKVIKVFRGIKYRATSASQPIAVVESQGGSTTALKFLGSVSKYGFRNASIEIGQGDLGVLDKYTWLASIQSSAPSAIAPTLQALWTQGKNIVTVGVGNGMTQLPHYASTPTAPTTINQIAVNGDFELAGVSTEIFRNRFPNPNCVTSLGLDNSWPGTAGNAFTQSNPAQPAALSGTARQWAWTVKADTTGDIGIRLNGSTLTAGSTYTIAYKIRALTAGMTLSAPAVFSPTGVVTTATRSRGANKTFALNEEERVWMTFTADSTALADAGIKTITNTITPGVQTWQIYDVIVTAGAWPNGVDFFSGNLVSGYWSDDDFTPVWTGTVNQSASVIRGDIITSVSTPTGWSSSSSFNCVSIRSKRWSKRGTYSVRIIPTGTSPDSCMIFAYLSPQDGKQFTMTATSHIETVQTGTLDSRARKIASYGNPAIETTSAPNVAGNTTTHTLPTVVLGGTTRQFRLYNGASLGGGDVWFDEMMLVDRQNYTGEWFVGAAAEYGIAPITRLGSPDRINQHTNPSVETTTSGWSAANGSSVTPGPSITGVQSARVTVPSGGVVDAGLSFGMSAMTLVAGEAYTVAVTVRPTTATTLRLSLQGAALGVSGITQALSANQVYRFVKNFVAPASGVLSAYVLRNDTNAVIFDADLAVLETGTTDGSYFSGSTPWTTQYAYEWTGTAEFSVSNRRPRLPIDAPTSGAFVTEAAQPPTPGTAPSAVLGGAQALALWTETTSTPMITAAMMRHPSGGYWIDIHLPDIDGTEAQKLLGTAMSYVSKIDEFRTWETQMGEFYIDSLNESNFPHQMKVTGRDAVKKMMQSKLPRVSSFPAGTSLLSFVRGQAAQSGIPTSKMKFEIGSETFTSEMSFDKGTPRWEMIKSALESFDYERFIDGRGFFVVRKYLDPSTSPTTMTFKTGGEGNLVTFERSTNDSRIFNHIIVTATPSDGNVVPSFGEAINDDPASPTRRSRLGDRVWMIDADWLSSDEQCEELAKSRLKISSLESYELNFSSIYYPWLECGEIVEILDPDALGSEPTRFLMDSISYPMALGPMSATGKRVTIISASVS